MTKKILTCFALLFVFNVCCMDLKAQVVVKKTSEPWKGNPSLYFTGISNDKRLEAAVLHDLKNCGWFTLSKNASSTYSLNAAVSGGKVSFSVKGPKRFSTSVNKMQTNRETAHKIVDTMIRAIFNVPGICSSKIAFCVEYKKGYKELFVCDYDGSNFKQVTRNGMLSVEPEWSPNGSRLYYTLSGQGKTNIVEYFMASRKSRRYVQFSGLNAGAAISPNGRNMAMILSKDKQVELYVMVMKTRQLKRLTKSSYVEASPCWSPDGRNICFTAATYGNPKLHVIKANGGPMTKIPTIGVEAVAPDWSCKDQIVYSARMGKNYTIGLTDMTGKFKPMALVNAAGDWDSPSWAPDGRHIICSRTFKGKSSLYIIDSWTKKSRELLRSGKNNFSMPCWSGKLR